MLPDDAVGINPMIKFQIETFAPIRGYSKKYQPEGTQGLGTKQGDSR